MVHVRHGDATDSENAIAKKDLEHQKNALTGATSTTDCAGQQMAGKKDVSKCTEVSSALQPVDASDCFHAMTLMPWEWP